MTVIMPLNTWANMCGHFFNSSYGNFFGPHVNNGYNCDHVDNEEVYEHVGCCYAHSCPLAYHDDGLMCQRFGINCVDCGNEDCECEDDMMVCEIPDDQYDEEYMYKEVDNG